MTKCKWCGSSKHGSRNCSIKQKHQALLDGASIEAAGFDGVIEISCRPNLQTESGAWANVVFGKSQTTDGIINHLIKEVWELKDSNSPEEAADCLLLLFQHAHECGYNLIEEAWKKHEINLKRKWGKPDKYGVIEHIKETR